MSPILWFELSNLQHELLDGYQNLGTGSNRTEIDLKTSFSEVRTRRNWS